VGENTELAEGGEEERRWFGDLLRTADHGGHERVDVQASFNAVKVHIGEDRLSGLTDR
jgi:hypothetical protein